MLWYLWLLQDINRRQVVDIHTNWLWRPGKNNSNNYLVDQMVDTNIISDCTDVSWWHYSMEALYALLVLCEDNPLVIIGFRSTRAYNVIVDVFFVFSQKTVETTTTTTTSTTKIVLKRPRCNAISVFLWVQCPTKVLPLWQCLCFLYGYI